MLAWRFLVLSLSVMGCSTAMGIEPASLDEEGGTRGAVSFSNVALASLQTGLVGSAGPDALHKDKKKKKDKKKDKPTSSSSESSSSRNSDSRTRSSESDNSSRSQSRTSRSSSQDRSTESRAERESTNRNAIGAEGQRRTTRTDTRQDGASRSGRAGETTQTQTSADGASRSRTRSTEERTVDAPDGTTRTGTRSTVEGQRTGANGTERSGTRQSTSETDTRADGSTRIRSRGEESASRSSESADRSASRSTSVDRTSTKTVRRNTSRGAVEPHLGRITVATPKVKVSFETSRVTRTPLHRTMDHRYARPHHLHVVHHPVAYHAPPKFRGYKPYYTHWYVHPFYRHRHATTVVVSLPFVALAWDVAWAPPYRHGWTWVAGHWIGRVWVPGHWRPTARTIRTGYAYVPGYWDNDIYVDGWYRVEDRGDDWIWQDGYYLEDGTFVRGHWVPGSVQPQGYMWEAGFWDGELWVEGFWRPEYRADYIWVSSYYDEDGVYRSGYWMPIEERPGFAWIPGWFDGNEWVEGYWVRDDEVTESALSSWEATDGWDDGWNVGGGWGEGEVLRNDSYPSNPDERPLGLPVVIPED